MLGIAQKLSGNDDIAIINFKKALSLSPKSSLGIKAKEFIDEISSKPSLDMSSI
jgi:hypothetical protein